MFYGFITSLSIWESTSDNEVDVRLFILQEARARVADDHGYGWWTQG